MGSCEHQCKPGRFRLVDKDQDGAVIEGPGSSGSSLDEDSVFCHLWEHLLSIMFFICGYGSIPIHTIFSGMNIHLPAILGFTRYQGFDPSPCNLGHPRLKNGA